MVNVMMNISRKEYLAMQKEIAELKRENQKLKKTVATPVKKVEKVAEKTEEKKKGEK